MMTNLLLDITSATIDWSRAQFALTAIYTYLGIHLVGYSQHVKPLEYLLTTLCGDGLSVHRLSGGQDSRE